MIVLGLDTALPACSVAIMDGETVRCALAEPMMRGHQERLAPMAAEVLAASGLAPDAIDRVAVGVGPGSFTGLRVGLSFAKAFALALDIPCVGIGSLHALAETAGHDGVVAAAVDAKRGQVYLQIFCDGVAVSAPVALDIAAAQSRLVEIAGSGPLTLIGSGAAVLAPVAPAAHVLTVDAPDPVALCRLGMTAERIPARPLYLRAPDAKLPGGLSP